MRILRDYFDQMFNRLTFRTKLLILIFICVIIPSILSLTNIILTTSNTIKKQAIKSEEYTIQLAYTYLSQKFDEIIQVMNFVQFDDEILQTLNQGMYGDISPRSYLNINRSLDHLTRNSDISVSIVLLNDEHSFTNQGFTSKLDQGKLKMKGHTLLQDLSSFNVYWFSNNDFPSDEQRIILGRKIVNHSGTTVAYLYAGINSDGIDKVLNRNEFQKTREFLVLDSNHEVIYGVENSFIEGEKWLKDNREKNDAFFKTFDDLDYLVVQKHFLNSDWMLVSYMPYTEVVQELGETYKVNIYIQLLAFIFLIIFVLYAVSMYTRPINRLALVASDIHKGNLNTRSNIHRQDEIGKLSLAFDSMLDRIQAMIKQITKEQELKIKAEISYLHAKIKPHFIYNVLNTIRLQAMKNGDSESSKSIFTFTQFLRGIYTVSETITLEQELDHTVNYLNLINKMRKFPITLKIEAENDTLLNSVPSFFLQPIVENSVKHGDLKENGEIEINARVVNNNRMMITIKDNGVGAGEQLKDIQSHLSLGKNDVLQRYEQGQYGIGLENIYQRMKILYGSKFTMDVKNGFDNGFIVILIFPLEEGCDHEGNAC